MAVPSSTRDVFATGLWDWISFHAAKRDFIHNGEGRTLADAVVCHRENLQAGKVKRPIAKQIQDDQHFCYFFAAIPGATCQQANDAWWEKRSIATERPGKAKDYTPKPSS
jgi:hypothetical protein